MISSISGQSQEEVMAEFDRIFGAVGGTTQNPMAYRKTKPMEEDKDKKTTKIPGKIAASKKSPKTNKVFILLPEGIKTEEVLEKLGRVLGERYLLMISSFYSRGLLKKKSRNELGNYLSGNWKILRRLGGEKYAELVRVAVAEFRHLKRSPRIPVAGVQSGSYALNAEVLNLKRQFRYELTTANAVKVRMEHQQERRTVFASNHAVYTKISTSVDGLTFDYAAAGAYVAGLADGEAKEHRKAVLEQLAAGQMPWVFDQQGRNYTVLVSVPRDIRRFFSYGSEPLWVVDVSSSQPLLHATLYPEDCDEKKKYLAVVQAKSSDRGFWAFMRDAAGVKCDLNDEEAKGKMKEQIFQEVFYSFSQGKQGPKRPFAKAFQREFPLLWEHIDAAKKRHGPKQSSGLAKAMMWAEAWAVFDAINALKDKPYPLISIHDAIATTKDGVADVTAALAAAFLPAKLAPRLAAKILTTI